MDANWTKKADELAQESATQATSLEDLNRALRALMKTALEKMLNTELELHLGRGVSAAAAVLKELTTFATAYNLVRLEMHVSAWLQGVAPERISFLDALRWLCAENSAKSLANLKVNSERPGRYEPRVRKQRPKQFPLMTKPRQQLQQEYFHKQLTA